MAAPAFVQAGTGVIATTAAANPTLTGATIGNVVIVHYVYDGPSTVSAPASSSGVQSLIGTANDMTVLFPGGLTGATGIVGAGSEAIQAAYIGRATGTTVSTFVSPGDAGEDVYVRFYEFSDVAAGTTRADVAENVTAGAGGQAAATSTTVADVGVTTLGPDRLACNFIAMNDDATGITSFTGASGGTWNQVALFESATGTDGTIALQTATIASAGTINGGTATITSDPWGVVGFALIGTTPDTPPTLFYVTA